MITTLDTDTRIARLVCDRDPFATFIGDDPACEGRPGRWPAAWIRRDDEAGPGVTAYRSSCTLDAARNCRLHLSADQWAEVFLDGVPLGRVPDRCGPTRWLVSSVDCELAAGEHVLLAIVYDLGDHAPLPVMSVASGFICCPDPDDALVAAIATGHADWQWRELPGLDVVKPRLMTAAAGESSCDLARWPALDELLAGRGTWRPVAVGRNGCSAGSTHVAEGDRRPLAPTRLAALDSHRVANGRVRQVAGLRADEDREAVPCGTERDLPAEHAQWQQLLDGGAITIAPGRRVRALIDLGDYVSVEPALTLDGGAGAAIRLGWSEALIIAPSDAPGHRRGKTRRDRYEGCWCTDVGDQWQSDGTRRRVHPYWWRCGRWLTIEVHTRDKAVTLSDLRLIERHAPQRDQGGFACDDTDLPAIVTICERALQHCAHDTYMDCPFYEQKQWVGDLRPQLLGSLVMGGDTGLMRQSLELVADSARGGMTQARYPAEPVCVIPGFALWYIAAVHDYARWRGDADFVRELMPTLRHNAELALTQQRADGLLRLPPGWNYVDWVRDWERGIPPHDDDLITATWNWQAVLVLRQLAELEDWLGEAELTARLRQRAERIATASMAAFWDEERGVMRDSPAHQSACEHAQCLAILSGDAGAQANARMAAALAARDGTLAASELFFSHYVVEALVAAGRMDAVFERLAQWRVMLRADLRTTPELFRLDDQNDPLSGGTRSDCHAWAAHPLYHAYASILGVRPAAMGFEQVIIRPRLGPLQRASGRVPHPAGGWIEVVVQRDGEGLVGTVALPQDRSGHFIQPEGHLIPLTQGANRIG